MAAAQTTQDAAQAAWDHAASIGQAYAAGIIAQQVGSVTNPYYADTQQWIAFNHGAEDQAAWTLKRGAAT